MASSRVTNQPKYTKHMSLGWALNSLAAVSAHIPCCGSQLFIGIFGAQTLGALSTSYFYKFQFFMPLIISACLAGFLLLWGKLHHIRHTSCNHNEICNACTANIKNFFILNLIVGYVVVGILYFFIPPHKHYPVDIHANGNLSKDHETVFVSYHDHKRVWPWSERLFIAKANSNPEPAQELFWYNFISKRALQNADSAPVPIHLYARPNNKWLANNESISSPLQFYITLKNPQDFISSHIIKSPSLVMFYRHDCAPCQVEMRMLPEIKQSVGNVHIAVVSFTTPNKILKETLHDLDIQLIDASVQDTLAFLRFFNSQDQALPFSLFFDENGALCTQRTGLLGLNIIKDWRKQCLR